MLGSRALAALAALLMAGLLVVGCAPGPTGSPPPSNVTGASGSPTASAPSAETPSTSPGGPPPSQTETAWGRIWDALPASFPTPPGSHPATDTGEGPASGWFVVLAARQGVVQFYQGAFAAANYSTSTDGPLEDGSVKITANDGYQCRIEVSVLGSDMQQLMVKVLYGAGCPFEADLLE